MNWQEALAEIESVEFDTNVNVVSGLKAFFRAVDKEPSVREAFQLLRESGDVREDALGRILDLSVAGIDLQYENPHDTPLAVLLWLTYYTAPEFVKLAAQYVSSSPNCWYANKLAKSIAMPTTVNSGNLWIDVGIKGWDTANNSARATSLNMLDTGVKVHFLPGAGASKVMSENQEQIVRELS